VLRRFELDHDGKLNGWEKPRPGTEDAAEWLVHATDGIAWLGAQKRAGVIDDVIVLAKDSHRTGRLAFYGTIEEARAFFGKERMEEIVMSVNRTEEGGEGKADEYIMKYVEVQHG
jgi:hypothetical protein